MIVIAWAVKIRWPHRDEVDVELLPIYLRQLDVRNFGDRVPLIGTF